MKKQISIIVSVLLLSTFSFCHKKENIILAELSFKKEKTKDTCDKFPEVKLYVKLINQSNDSLFIINIANKVNSAHERTMIFENYGSFENQIESSKRRVHSFIETEYKKGTIKDSFEISIPSINKRYQINNKRDTIDFIEKWDYLKEIYCSYHQLCERDSVPYTGGASKKKSKINFYLECFLKNNNIPNENYDLDLFLEEAVFLKPHETKIMVYDIGSFFLQKATYKFVFTTEKYIGYFNDRLQNESFGFLENIDTIMGYKKYVKPIISSELIIQSQ